MGRQSIDRLEEERIVRVVMAATNAYGRDLEIVMTDGEIKRGRSSSMGIRNTNWAEPLRGYVELTNERGETEDLDPLDIARIG